MGHSTAFRVVSALDTSAYNGQLSSILTTRHRRSEYDHLNIRITFRMQDGVIYIDGTEKAAVINGYR